MVTISDKAFSKINQIKGEAKLGSDYFLRVSVKGGGCSGLTYQLDFDNTSKAEDQVFISKGQKIVLDLKSFLYLDGSQLDFSDGLNGKGFNFTNPNATRTCGCGESFAV